MNSTEKKTTNKTKKQLSIELAGKSQIYEDLFRKVKCV